MTDGTSSTYDSSSVVAKKASTTSHIFVLAENVNKQNTGTEGDVAVSDHNGLVNTTPAIVYVLIQDYGYTNIPS